MGNWAKGELFWDDGESLDTFEHGNYSYFLFFAEEVQNRVNFGFMLTWMVWMSFYLLNIFFPLLSCVGAIQSELLHQALKLKNSKCCVYQTFDRQFNALFMEVKTVKGIVCSKLNICWKSTHPQAIQDVDEFVSSWEQSWRNLALHHLLTSGCSAVNGCRQHESPNSW